MEPKVWGMRASRFPQKHYGMAGVVEVLDRDGRGITGIRFSEAMVSALAKKMQYGISEVYPCHLRVVEIVLTGQWRVYCHYIGNLVGIKVLEYRERPHWLGKIRRVHHATKST